MANKRYEVNTVQNYFGKTISGALSKSVGYTMKDGWTNPDKNKLMRKAGFFYASEITKSNK